MGTVMHGRGDKNKEALLSLPLAKTIMATLAQHGYEARFCGGVVRDAVIGKLTMANLSKTLDIDMASTAPPREAMRMLNEVGGLKIIPSGIDHGTITIKENGAKKGDRVRVELTTLRADIKTDGRHAEVEFGDDWEADSNRRDFTINSMYMDGAGTVFNYRNGEEDAKAGVLQFIGDASTRIAEDYLRVLRYFRFHVDFNQLPPDDATRRALSEAAPHLKKLSGERIYKELKGILAKYAPETITLMHDLHIFRDLFPRPLNVAGYRRLHRLEQNASPLLRLAVLFYHQGLNIVPYSIIMRMTGEDEKRWLTLAKSMEDETVATLIAPDSFWQEIAYRLGLPAPLLVEWLLASLARSDKQQATSLNDIKKRVKEISNFKPKKMPVTGKDVIAMTGIEGKQVGEYLNMLEEAFIASGFRATRDELLSHLESHLTSHANKTK